jgi:hypothetical protein
MTTFRKQGGSRVLIAALPFEQGMLPLAPRVGVGGIFDDLHDQDLVFGSDGSDGFYDECEYGCFDCG